MPLCLKVMYAILVKVNWQLSKWGICWPVSLDGIACRGPQSIKVMTWLIDEGLTKGLFIVESVFSLSSDLSLEQIQQVTRARLEPGTVGLWVRCADHSAMLPPFRTPPHCLYHKVPLHFQTFLLQFLAFWDPHPFLKFLTSYPFWRWNGYFLKLHNACFIRLCSKKNWMESCENQGTQNRVSMKKN